MKPANSVTSTPTVDVLAIGAGPFNLGFAALAQPLVDDKELSLLVVDQRDGFCWHPGMMLDNATIQVPFMADLVTLADPTSPYSFLNYCKQRGTIHRFFIKEDFYPLRREYSNYCRWVSEQLSTIVWGQRVESVDCTPEGLYAVTLRSGDSAEVVHARHLLSGIGTQPFVPDALSPGLDATSTLHSAEYLHRKQELLEADSVTIIGSGQSAAEIYLDLLEPLTTSGRRLDWITRSPRFFPMEYTKLTLEMTSPDYANYFRALPSDVRDRSQRDQRNLYKGISEDTINEIYDLLYRLSLDRTIDTTLRAGCSVEWAPDSEPTDGSHGRHRLAVTHTESGARGVHATDAVIFATGYRAPTIAPFLQNIAEHINTDDAGRYAVTENFAIDDGETIFVNNADEHVHSLIAPDLGMGPWRNSIILRTILGREVYAVERPFAFQSFGGEGLC